MPLTNKQYDEILRVYQKRQLRNQHYIDQHKQELYRRIPKLRQLDDTIASVSVQQARLLLDGDTEALSRLKDTLNQSHLEKLQLMEKYGFPSDYLIPPYDCPDCKDTGYINNQRCHCLKQAAIDLIYTQSNLKEILEKENFQHFSTAYYSDTIKDPATGASALTLAQAAFHDSQSFIQNFDQEFRNLFFYGDTGVGKTFLSNCIARELMDSGHSVIYFTAFQLFDLLEKSKFGKDPDAAEHQQNIFNCDLLIIDDLGTELPNSFTVSQLFLCLNERLLRKKSTIISTNLGINQMINTYSERTFSRIFSQYTLFHLLGEDIRIQKKIK